MKNRYPKINKVNTTGIIFISFLCLLLTSCSNLFRNKDSDIKAEVSEIKKGKMKNLVKVRKKKKKVQRKAKVKRAIQTKPKSSNSDFSWSDEPLFEVEKKEESSNQENFITFEAKDTKDFETELLVTKDFSEEKAQKLIEGGKTVHIVNIAMRSEVFMPSKIKINQGDIVRWVNNDDSIDSHVLQGVPGSNPYSKEKDEIKLAKLYFNKTFQHTFERIGEFPYFCYIHKNMTGSVTVVKPGQSLTDMKKELKILTEKKKRFKKGSRKLLDEKEMIKIPAGKFIMGSPEIATDGPAHLVDLPEYYIDKYEVTNEEFEEFSDSSGYVAKGDWSSFYSEGREKYPVVNVMYKDVKAFADWAGKRIPSEAQWEKAARGHDRRLWPWGDDYDNEITNVFGPDEFMNTAPVGSFEEDVSPFGVFDMGGNVSEWTSSPFLPYKGSNSRHPDFSRKKATVRGGSYNTVYDIESRTHSRTGRRPNLPASSVGFRLVK